MSELFNEAILSNAHIVVTGGGTGLGRAMAMRFASLGAAVTINGRREEPLAKTVEDIRTAGGKAEGIPCDIRDAGSVEQFFVEAEERSGPVTGLVNNAAGNFLAAAEELSPNGFDAIVKTNLYGSFYCIQSAGKRWIERKSGGVVLSISTTYAESGSAFVLPSAVSKAGIVAMTKSLAVEWGDYGIRLNAIGPGPFPTKGAWERLVSPDFEEAMVKRVAIGRVGELHELTSLAVFLMSDLSTFMTGEHVIYDGGELLKSGGQFNHLTSMGRERIMGLFAAMRKG